MLLGPAARGAVALETEHGGADDVVVLNAVAAVAHERQRPQPSEQLVEFGGVPGPPGSGEGGPEDVRVQTAGQGAGEGGGLAHRVGLPLQEPAHGGRARVADVVRVGGAGLGEGGHQHRQSAGEPQHLLDDRLVRHPLVGEQSTRLGRRERPERHLGDEVGEAAPASGVEGTLACGDEDEVGGEGEVAVAVGGHDVVQPAVEERAGAFVCVEEQDDPGHRGADVVQLGEQHRGEDALGCEDQLHVVLVAQPGGDPGPHPVGAQGDPVGVERTGERSDDRNESGADEPDPGGRQTPGRWPLGLRFEAFEARDGGLGLVPPLPVGREEPLQLLEPPSLGRELTAHHRQRLRHAADALVDVRGECAALLGLLLQLPHQEGLSDSGVAVNMEAEAVAFVVRRQVEVGPERGPFGPPADETRASALLDQLTHRRARGLSHA